MTTTMTTAPTAPALTTAPAAEVRPPAPAPAPEPVAASRRSVHLLAAAVGGLAVACLLYVLVDRPGLRELLVAVATIVGGFSAPVAIAWAVYHAVRSR